MYELRQGDCLNLMNEIPDKSINLILCDLPYGQTARNKWDSVIPFEPLWQQYNRIIKNNGAILLFGNGMFTADLMQSNRDFIGMELEEEYFEIAKKRMYLSFMKENYKKSSEFWEELAKRKDLDDKYKY